METWMVVAVLLPAGYYALRWWLRYSAMRGLLAIPIVVERFQPIAADELPTDTRDILTERTAPLAALGFEFLGYVRVQGLIPSVFETRAAFRHPTNPAFAVVTFGLIGHELALGVSFYTRFEDGTWLDTCNGRAHQRQAELPHARYEEGLVATFAALWNIHLQAAAKIETPARGVASVDDVADHLNHVEAETARALVARGEAAATDEPTQLRRTLANAQRRSALYATAMARVTQSRIATMEFAVPRIPLAEEERVYQETKLGRELIRAANRRWSVLLVSAGAFAASVLLISGHAMLAILMPAVLLHELGHWVVMRFFGHKDASITFIPFFGAATITHRPFSKRWQEVLMLLAGPLPGLVLGVVMMIHPAFRRWSFASEAGAYLVGLNVLNLLPLSPLDGGRILHVLATAGRPRFDLALKAIASLAFLAIAVRLQEPILGLLGVIGLVAIRSGYQTAKLENRIRAVPGFDAHLPPAERRRLIFDAMSEAGVRHLGKWIQTTSALEISLSHARAPLWQVGFWAGGLALVVGGFAYLSYAGGKLMKGMTCPKQDTGQVVACGGDGSFVDVNWAARSHPDAPSVPAKTDTGPFRAAAFVWCANDDSAKLDEVHQRLYESQAGHEYCAALPWETAAGGRTAAEQRDARETLVMLSLVGEDRLYWSAKRLGHLDELIARSSKKPGFDLETARLYRQLVDPKRPPGDDAKRALGDRLGRSPDESCKRIALRDVTPLFPKRERADAAAAVDGAADDSDAVPFAIRLSVELASSTDFAPLGAYLCAHGCQVQLAPWPPGDPRLTTCF